MTGTTKPTPASWKEEDESRRAIYMAYLDDFARMGTRHETVRAFYLSLLTFLAGLVALASKGGIFESIQGQFFKGFAWLGILICIAWVLHTLAFSSLFKAKRLTLEQLEQHLELKPFSKERTFQKNRWFRLTWIDSIIVIGFLLIFVALLNVQLTGAEAPTVPSTESSQS